MDTVEPLSGLIVNRYRIEKELGTGGMGEVYLVRDLLEGEAPKALKTLPEELSDSETLERFKIEFETLAKLNHPNLEKVYDFEYDGERNLHFFTAEYIPGTDLLDATEGADSIKVVELTVQVCRALAYLHTRGIIHFDVKPANILVSPDRTSIKLIDFGLAGTRASELFGTPGYMAPEIFRESEVDRRADLYGLGVVLYQAVTGEYPFRSRTTASLARRQLEDRPIAPSHWNRGVPKPLERIILKLLEKEPSDRFSSAQEVILAVNEGLGTDYEVETPATAAGYVLTTPLIGREAELGRLRELFKASVETESAPYGKHPAAVLIRGAPGVGKNRLVKELRWYAQLRGAAFLECAAGPEGGAPLEFLASAVTPLVALAGPEDPAVREFEGSAASFLVTGEAVPKEDPDAPDRPKATSLFESVIRFLLEVSSRHPFVLHIRDGHAVGSGEAGFIGRIVRSMNLWRREGGWTDPSGNRVTPRGLIVATAVKEEAERNPHLQGLVTSFRNFDLLEEMTLEELGERHVGRLVETILGPTAEARGLAEAIHDELGGNPLAVIEAMKFLLDEGVLQYGDGGWSVDLEAVTRPGGVPTVSKALAVRAGQLAPGGRAVLEALAVLDERAGVDTLEAVLAFDAPRVLRELVKLKRAGFVQSVAEEGVVRYVLPHAMIREVIYEGIDEKKKAELHGRIGAHMEKAAPETPERLSRMGLHFHRSGDRAKARRYALGAADRFVALQLHGETARALRLVLDSAPPEEEAAEVVLRLGVALCNAGESRESLELVEKAMAEAPDEGEPGFKSRL
ncbi:MAG: serine/threonine-protein kinase, partial [Planctomycetota bacterium]